MSTKYHFVRELYNNNIAVKYHPSTQMSADLLTKTHLCSET